jgi:hypothetical protein
MEIVSVVLEGALGHKDSIGNGTTILPGEVQRMSAGSGIRHSEFNHSQSGTTHFLQIWILPNVQGIAPGYEQKHFAPEAKRGVLKLVASPDDHANAKEGALKLHADAAIYLGLFDGAERASLSLDPERLAYVHVARGSVSVNGQPLATGDAAQIADESRLELSDGQAAEVIVFDLAR